MEFEQRLENFRHALAGEKADAYIIPQTDVHRNEYLPAHFMRLAWLTGFTGSAGMAIVGRSKAAIFVDGRYTLQAQKQVDPRSFEVQDLSYGQIEAWLSTFLTRGNVIAYDPWLLTEAEVRRYEKLCQKTGVTLRPLPENLVERVWQDRPEAPNKNARLHSLEWSGFSISDKISQVCKTLDKHKADAALLTQVDSVAWLLNMRGEDISFLPVVLSFAIVYAGKKVDLFIDPRKITADFKDHFTDQVRIHPYETLEKKLQELGGAQKNILMDSQRAPFHAVQVVEQAGGKVIRADDVCLLPKACKNPVEVEGARRAHQKDAVALVHLLAWLEEAMTRQKITELDIVRKLKEYRTEQGAVDDSFSTIAGSGPHGAIIHYRVTPETNRTLRKNELLLLDSGGQYPSGTTDVTRTMVFGMPTAEQKDRFTRVLKGHIRLGAAKFPQGTTGHQLDSLARYALWQAGLDYAHGTGHGVGSFLSVHEGPQRISGAFNEVALQPGMIVSNEPGYYKAESYGIRIENLVVVTRCPHLKNSEQPMLCFETLTLVPIDRRLMELSMMTAQEIEWLDRYHQRVLEVIGPKVQPFARQWLQTNTRPLL